MGESLIGVPRCLIPEILSDSIQFAKETGYLLDSEQLILERDKYVEDIVGILMSSDGVLESYEEDGMYVVSPSVELQVNIVSSRIVYIKAMPFVASSEGTENENKEAVNND